MIWSSDYYDEIEKAREYATHPERFQHCANGWLLEGNHHLHCIQMMEDGLQCSCETFKRKTLAGQPWCHHTRAIELLLATGQLVRAHRTSLLLVLGLNDQVLFALT